MNKLKGIIKDIQSYEGISLIDIAIDEDEFSSLIINSNITDEYIKLGNYINLLFKETEVSVKNYHPEFHKKRKNKIVTIVKNIQKGIILSEIQFEYRHQTITAIILSRLLNELDLHVNDKAIVILRTQEILLSKTD
jgi:molybdopterin-binding protein